MFAIAFVLVSVLFLVVTGSIVLAITPGFRWTIGNVVIFVVGAFPGMFVLPNLGSRTSVTTVPEMYVFSHCRCIDCWDYSGVGKDSFDENV